MTGSPASPCVRNCCLDDNDVCMGCLRTLREILDWHEYTDAQKLELLDQLQQRRQQSMRKLETRGTAKRCFLGLALAAPIHQALYRHAQQLKKRVAVADFNWIPAENYHITLNFLGSISPSSIEPLYGLLAERRWLQQPLHLRIDAVGGFPKPSKARYLVAQIQANTELLQLQDNLSRVLQETGFKLDSQTYRPHITLARLRHHQGSLEVPSLNIEPVDFSVARISLFESILTNLGSHYVELEQFD